MNKLTTLAAMAALTFGLAACGAPAEDENADTGPEVATVDTATSDVVGDADTPPTMETVQAAIDEACPTLRTQLVSATCDAEALGQSFACDFALNGDPEGTTREVTLTQSNGGWMVESDPAYCSSLERAEARADEPADISVDTQPE
jgi:hypothetical protein